MAETVPFEDYENKCIEYEELNLEFEEFKEISKQFEEELEAEIENLQKKISEKEEEYLKLEEKYEKEVGKHKEESEFFEKEYEDEKKKFEQLQKKFDRVNKSKIRLEIENEGFNNQMRMKDMIIEELEMKAEEVLEKLTILEMEAMDVQERNEEEKMRLKMQIKEVNDEFCAFKRKASKNQTLSYRRIPTKKADEIKFSESTASKTNEDSKYVINVNEPGRDDPKNAKKPNQILSSNSNTRSNPEDNTQRISNKGSPGDPQSMDRGVDNSGLPVLGKSASLALPNSPSKKIFPMTPNKYEKKFQVGKLTPEATNTLKKRPRKATGMITDWNLDIGDTKSQRRPTARARNVGSRNPIIQPPRNEFMPDLSFTKNQRANKSTTHLYTGIKNLQRKNGLIKGKYDNSVDQGWNVMKQFSFSRIMKKVDTKLATIKSSLFKKNKTQQMDAKRANPKNSHMRKKMGKRRTQNARVKHLEPPKKRRNTIIDLSSGALSSNQSFTSKKRKNELMMMKRNTVMNLEMDTTQDAAMKIALLKLNRAQTINKDLSIQSVSEDDMGSQCSLDVRMKVAQVVQGQSMK